MSRIRVFLLGLLLLAQPGLGVAETVANLYSAEVVAADRSQAALNRAAREGLQQVLVKVSGTSALLNNPGIKPALGNARTYVQRYSYLPAEPDDEGVGVRLQFAGSTINELITDAGAPLWTANRPAVLTWLALRGPREEGGPGGERLAGRDAEQKVDEELAAAFSRRGVPVKLPSGGSSAVAVNQLWRMSPQAITKASAPYQLDDVLVGRLTYDDQGRASGQWTYLFDGAKRDRSVSATSEQQFMDAGVNLVADAMAARLAVAPTDTEADGLLMSVIGITRYADYAAVVKWLEELELVDQANLVHVNGDKVEFRVIAQIDASQLAGLIQMNRRLIPLPGPAGVDSLSYQWQN